MTIPDSAWFALIVIGFLVSWWYMQRPRKRSDGIIPVHPNEKSKAKARADRARELIRLREDGHTRGGKVYRVRDPKV